LTLLADDFQKYRYAKHYRTQPNSMSPLYLQSYEIPAFSDRQRAADVTTTPSYHSLPALDFTLVERRHLMYIT